MCNSTVICRVGYINKGEWGKGGGGDTGVQGGNSRTPLIEGTHMEIQMIRLSQRNDLTLTM